MFNVLVTLFLAVAAYYGLDLWSTGQFPLQSDVQSLFADTPAQVTLGTFAAINLLLWSAMRSA